MTDERRARLLECLRRGDSYRAAGERVGMRERLVGYYARQFQRKGLLAQRAVRSPANSPRRYHDRQGRYREVGVPMPRYSIRYRCQSCQGMSESPEGHAQCRKEAA
jgi:hypothetical protein